METTSPTRLTIQGGNYNGQAVGWPFGVDSFSHPLFVDPRQLRWMENAVLQGAFAQVRPGYRTAATFDTAVQGSVANQWWIANEGPVVHPQMCVSFTPTGGTPQLVFAISGSVFFCAVNTDGTLGTITRIPGFQFNPNADVLVGCRCVQTATIVGGILKNNVGPRNLLVIQDGVNRAGIWDGAVGVHMNPTKRVTTTPAGDTLYPEAYNQTRIGLWMAWSGNRLFVFDGPNGYASDPNDPTHFTEELNYQSFRIVFPEDVTGAVDRGSSGTTRSQVVVFTSSTTWTLWSGILNRLPSQYGVGWQYTDDFQVKIFDGVGCVAGKSAIVHRGLLYWKSQGGIVLFDSVQTVNSSQNLPPIDSEMAYSKMRIAPSPTGMDLTCGGRFENFVWWSVPVGRVTAGRRYNAHTQVLDRQTSVSRTTAPGTFSSGTTGWQGVWSGIRPVEWASVKTGGRERVYAISLDSETGAVNIWEAFQANRADNGHRIPWLVETRLHPVQPKIFEYANFRHFRLLMDQIGGNVDIVGSWRGLKGRYHELLNTRITATPGTVFLPLPQFTPVTNDTKHYSLGLQGRTVISPNHQGVQDCGSARVESEWDDGKDHAFSLAIRITGRAALSAYMIAVDSSTDTTEGTAQSPTGLDETGFNLLAEPVCPQHIAGTTPDYIAGKQPQPLVSCPYLSAQSLTVDYIAPTA